MILQISGVSLMPNVCEVCIEDPTLQEVVRQTAESEECDYCQRKADKTIATDVCEIAGYILAAVDKEFIDPANELPYETAEGGYQGSIIDNPYDLFAEIDFALENEKLYDDIADCIAGDVWLCRRDYYAPNQSERLIFGWDAFKDVVKHRRRYTLWSIPADSSDQKYSEYPNSAQMLPELAEAIARAGLIREMQVGSQIWRVRVHEADRTLRLASDFSSPPLAQAKYANRMSPAGVPMFYGAADFDTAMVETVDAKHRDGGHAVSGARFETVVPIRVLDLVSLPDPPSFFSDQDEFRHTLYFLRSFTRDVSRPITKDGREHIDYVPTQVFTEFVRYELQTIGPIHGVVYPSAWNRGKCYVIFAQQDECLDDDGKWRSTPQILRFVKDSIERRLLDND
jgi:HEPN/RES N-terminal domain 1/RES domain